jgi:hypothetical protein
VIEKASVSQPLSAPASNPPAAAFGSMLSTNDHGSPLVVRTGTRVVVELPRTGALWRWSTPTPVGAAVHASRPQVEVHAVHAVQSGGAVQEFLVTTGVPTTVVLEAQDDVFAGRGPVPSNVPGSTTSWALELKVEES